MNINGITESDFEVTIWDDAGEKQFSFTIVGRDDERYDIYYDYEQTWWPMIDGENAAFNFIPDSFSEDCENLYSCDGDGEKILKEHGFTKFIYEEI